MAKIRKTVTSKAFAVSQGIFYIEEADQCPVDSDAFQSMLEDSTIKAIRVESLASDWIECFWFGDELREDAVNVQMTLRKELRGNTYHWYAYRRVLGRLHKRYVGTSDTIDQRKLATVAKRLPG